MDNSHTLHLKSDGNMTDTADTGDTTDHDTDGGHRTWYRQLTGVTCYCLGLFVRIALDLAL